jgi:uncharacterized membrane protein YuzA (DUF378 family)
MLKIKTIFLIIMLIGCLNWGSTAFGYDIVKIISNQLDPLSIYKIDKIIYITIALCAILLVSCKYTWLPFLDSTIVPSSIIPLSTPKDANMKINIKVCPNTKIVYWAAYLNKNENITPEEAYKDNMNAGVVISDENGNAELKIIEGSGYKVSCKHLKRHIHYRICKNNILMSRIYTIFY